MKKEGSYIILFFLVISVVSAKEIIVIEDKFQDNDYSANPTWVVSAGSNINVINEELHVDGAQVDSSGRYLSTIYSLNNFSTQEKIIISYKGKLLSSGFPQEGRGILLKIWGNEGSYLLNLQRGYTSGFPINQESVSLVYDPGGLPRDYIVTPYVPERDAFYQITAIRENSTWYLHVNGILIGTHEDTLNANNFKNIILYTVGSVVIDDIEIIVETEDEEPEINPLLEKYAPVFYTHPREKYTIHEIQSLMNYSDLKKNWNDFVSSAPTTVDEITGLEDSKKYYMDMINVNVNDLYDYPNPDDFTEFNSKLYGRVKKDVNNFTHLQYYLFYPYQDWYTMGHEGDWQLVEIVLDRNDVLYSVVYYFNRWRVIYYDLDLINFVNDTHPVVLVAEGSHNNYARDDALVFSFNIPEHMRFWGELFWGLKKLDKLDTTGRVYKPQNLPLSQNEVNYEIEEIDSETPWIYYEGRWGQKSFNPWWSGPRGPKYNQNFQDWDYPDTLASAIKFPFMGSILYSPLDLSVYDSKGNLLDETDFFINTGSNESPESIFATGYENYTLFLTANDYGQFTLDLYYYDNITDSGIMLRYENITNTNTSEGYVNISYNSYYVLWLDYDEDGIFESLFLPDMNVTYNRNYVLPDLDEDGVNDYLDNCPETPNKDQADVDMDGKGNICENSVLLKEEAMFLLETYVPENKNEEKRIENAKRHLQESLNPELWTDSFTPITAHVFMDEFVSTKNFDWDIKYKSILTEADRLIVLYSLDPENSKANYFYELGNEQFSAGNYSQAIIYYKNAWKFLNKKT